MRFVLCAVATILLGPFSSGPAQAWELDLQCVPFARAVSGIRLFGDAWRWWSQAVGRYDRGQVPAPGSVLAFRPNANMPLGHVAVVRRVVGTRRIEIDHANWAAPGAISTNIVALDVSPGNDWSAVRVELGRSERFGSIYATEGFIYGKGGGTGAGTPGRERLELVYVGKALAAARQSPMQLPAKASAVLTRVAQPALQPWNPVPLAPALPAFLSQKIAAGPSAADRAHGRVF